ncbi:hypothetical protein [Pedococcus sp. 5OH_020]|uniref:hypothetical protein n=1 Tax=Pedococcus sp. 5OH_020 TaxID=2989814 RepID=UPI0022EA0490|nr:hypothetical protein [Pedococcus sp. 5OH_020]
MAEVLTPRQALSRFEPEWRDQLGSVNLVGEFEVPAKEATLLLQAVGMTARKPDGPAALRRFPACVATSLATFAGAHYAGGGLWESLFSHIGIQDSPHLRSVMGSAFRDALEALDLPTVDDGLVNLGPITFHAVIPDYCLRDVLVLLAERQRLNPLLDGHSFLAWAEGHPSRLASLDKPAARFLTHGGEFAADLVDRLLDLLASLSAGEREVDQLVAASGAPARMVAAATALVDAGLLDVSRARRAVSSRGRSGQLDAPQLLLDFEHTSLLFRLPQWDGFSDEPVRWKVMLDGALTELHDGRHDTGAGRAAFEAAVVARPVRTLTAVLGEAFAFDLTVVNAEFPVLAFDRLGRFMPGGNPLPDEDVWLLYPEGEGQPNTDGGAIDRLIQLMGPVGWVGWTLALVSLKTARTLGWSDQTRPVHHRGRPQMEMAEPTLGMHTRTGQPLFTDRPSVRLPRLSTATDWRIEVRDVVTGDVLADDLWSNDARSAEGGVEGYADPFDGWDAPVVGEFDLLVRGPLGTRASWRVALAEGLLQRSSVYCRTFVADGLTPVTVDWGSSTGLAIEPARHDFRADERSRPLHVSGPRGALDLACTPNHLEVCRVSGGEASAWSAAALSLPSDGSDDLGFLEVRMAADQSLPPLSLVTASGLTQTVPSTGGAGARQRFDLARLADTLAAEKSATLQWQIGDEAATILARFRPNRLAAGASLQDSELVLDDFAGLPDVAAAVYQILAPWRAPVVCPVSADGRATLTDDLLSAGPLAVYVRSDDPWAPAPWPRWPEKPYRLASSGSPAPLTADEGLAIHYLAGLTRAPQDARSFPYLWVAWERGNAIVDSGAAPLLRTEIPAVLSHWPTDAVSALMKTDIPRESALLMAMSAGLLWAHPEMPADVQRTAWNRYPALASTSSGRTQDLPWDEIVGVCGPMAEMISAGEAGWVPSAGRFEHASFLNAMSSHQFEALWSAAGIVPRGWLDVDSRAAASRTLFQHRRRPDIDALARTGSAFVKHVDGLLKDSGNEGLRQWLAHRGSPTPSWSWETLPQVSAAFAALARTAARDGGPARETCERLVANWQTLARLAPDMVTIDVLLAEMLIRAQTDPYHRPEIAEDEG